MTIKSKITGDLGLFEGVKKAQQVSKLTYMNSTTGQKIQNFSLKHWGNPLN